MKIEAELKLFYLQKYRRLPPIPCGYDFVTDKVTREIKKKNMRLNELLLLTRAVHLMVSENFSFLRILWEQMTPGRWPILTPGAWLAENVNVEDH